jgi:hypothetical protein
VEPDSGAGILDQISLLAKVMYQVTSMLDVKQPSRASRIVAPPPPHLIEFSLKKFGYALQIWLFWGGF